MTEPPDTLEVLHSEPSDDQVETVDPPSFFNDTLKTAGSFVENYLWAVIVIVAVLVLLIVGLIVFCVVRRRRNSGHTELKEETAMDQIKDSG